MEEKLQKALTRAEQSAIVYDALLPILEQWKDKKANKRIATALEQVLPTKKDVDGQTVPAFVVSWNNDHYGDRAVHVWGNGIDYENRIGLTITTPQKYGSMSKTQTEAEAMADAINMVTVWKENNRRAIAQYREELKNADKMARDYARMLAEHKKNMAALHEKYGTAELWRGVEGKKTLTYTAREALEALHGKPETL